MDTPEPMGAWGDAIDHLNAAKALMGQMVCPPDARGRTYTVADPFTAQIATMSHWIRTHWSNEYMKAATATPVMVVVDPDPPRRCTATVFCTCINCTTRPD